MKVELRNGIPFIRGANYAKAVRTAADVLMDYGVDSMPLWLEQIIDALSNEIRLVKYTSLIRPGGFSYTEVVEFMDSDLGACALDPRSCRYVIYYNDRLSDAWCRFTIAHELGHIFLEHHLSASSDLLSRTFVPKEQYREYENEANAFARNLLSPAPLANMVMKHRGTEAVAKLEWAFFITSKAAETRIGFLKRDLRYCTEDILQSLRSIRLNELPYSCDDCGCAIPSGSEYCPGCGSNRFRRRFQYTPLPEPIYTDHLHSVLMCPRCGSTDLSLGARFCRICGAPAINICRGTESGPYAGQRHYNPHYARFCLTCGVETVFSTYHVLTEDIQYMHKPIQYSDGVPYSTETMRVQQCPRCHNTEFSPEAQFCRICGASLYNYCDGVQENEMEQWVDLTKRHPNPSNARFCETCGRPTYFFNSKILCDYTKYVPEDKDQDKEESEDGDDGDVLFGTNSELIRQEIEANPGAEGYLPQNRDPEEDGLPF